MSTHASIRLVRLQTPEQGLPQPGSALPQPSAGGPRFSSRLPAVGGGLGVPILGHHSSSDSLLHSLPQFLASLLLKPEVVDVATDGLTGRLLMRRKSSACLGTWQGLGTPTRPLAFLGNVKETRSRHPPSCAWGGCAGQGKSVLPARAVFVFLCASHTRTHVLTRGCGSAPGNHGAMRLSYDDMERVPFVLSDISAGKSL